MGFEVIVVNDGSTDDTLEVLERFTRKFPHLKVVNIPKDTPHTLKGKKFALSQGVAQAKYSWLLLTDADCRPASGNWLQLMVGPLAEGKSIVAGYGAYNPSNTVLNKYTRWESVHAFFQLTAFARAGMPYMAVGRNLACTKGAFEQAQANPIWNASASGDDDLLVNIAGTTENYAIVDNPDSFTFTDAKASFAEWIKQKQRHLTDGKNYRLPIKRILFIYGFTHAATWFYFVTLLFTGPLMPSVVIMAVRCFVYWVLYGAMVIKMKEKRIIYLLPLFDFGWMIHNFVFLPYILHKSKQHWK